MVGFLLLQKSSSKDEVRNAALSMLSRCAQVVGPIPILGAGCENLPECFAPKVDTLCIHAHRYDISMKKRFGDAWRASNGIDFMLDLRSNERCDELSGLCFQTFWQFVELFDKAVTSGRLLMS